MTVEDDLARLAGAVADAAAVRAGEVVLLLGDEDAGPLAVALTAALGRRGAVVRPWLHLGSTADRRSPAADALIAGLAARADLVVGVGTAPPATAGRSLRVAVPSHATAQDAGRSLPAHVRALAAEPAVELSEPAGG